MFPAEVYIERRNRLKRQIQSGLLLFFANEQSPMNYTDNQYPFRQDSSFLYFFGLDLPDLIAVIDVENGSETVFGNDLTIDDIVWTGPQPSLSERCHKIGITQTAPIIKLPPMLEIAVQQGRKIHFLPPYRPENTLKVQHLLRTPPMTAKMYASMPFIKAVIEQRSYKSPEEIQQIEVALEITCKMQTTAMKMSKPGIYERQIAGEMESIAISMGSRIAFPIIFSVHGEILHNPHHENLMQADNIAINDCGAESALHYASDITRTIPVSGKFSEEQKQIYSIVLNAQQKAIDAVKPGVEFRKIHLLACKALAAGLKDLGLMKGDIDQAVNAGAHALFFQCGLGHMMGLDVHDMEDLGEDYVGYTNTIKRSPQFGLRSLRLAKPLEPGFVITVEPGIYFIPELIDRYKAEKQFIDYVNYDAVERYKSFGGIRIEDNILVTVDGHRILGPKIPKTIEEVENMSSS